MRRSMGFKGGARGYLKRLHARHYPVQSQLISLGVGAPLVIPTGWNVGQFIAHGRLFVIRRVGESSWTYWNEDARDVVFSLLVSVGILALGLAFLSPILLHLVARLYWGVLRRPTKSRSSRSS